MASSVQPNSKFFSSLQGESAGTMRLRAEIAACDADVFHHFENHFWIVDKDARLRLMKPLKPAQKKLIAVLDSMRRMGLPLRVIILKARKEGLSTLVQALMLLAAMKENKTCLVIAHNSSTSKAIFQIGNRFYDNYDLPKPDIPAPNRQELRFKNQEGMMLVETANNLQAGTGLTPHFLHGSEVSKWAKGSEVAVSLFQAIGDSANTTVVLESTANGYDSLFQPMWDNAARFCEIKWSVDRYGNPKADIKILDKLNWNGYVPLFISWMEDPDYQIPFSSEDDLIRFRSILDPAEQSLIDKYEVSYEQLNWRRWVLANKCQGNISFFKQEYPSFPKEAFLVSGKGKFSAEKLDMMPVEEPVRGFLRQSETWDRKIQFVKEDGSPLYIYRRPKDGHRYVVSIDPAQGLQPDGTDDPDQTVAHVYDLDDGEGLRQVAVFAEHLPEEEAVEAVALLGEWYNLAFMFPFITGGYGHLITSKLLEQYPMDRIVRLNNQFGYKEHVGNKSDLVGSLAALINDMEIIFHDDMTVDQLKHYKRSKGGKLEAEVGWHDDHVSAAYGGARAARLYPDGLKPVRPGMIDRRMAGYASNYGYRKKRKGMDRTGGYSAC